MARLRCNRVCSCNKTCCCEKGADFDIPMSAAELLQDGRMSRAADVYSFAMIMWELFACKRLYEGHIASQVHFYFPFSHMWAFICVHSTCLCEILEWWLNRLLTRVIAGVFQSPDGMPAKCACKHARRLPETHAGMLGYRRC